VLWVKTNLKLANQTSLFSFNQLANQPHRATD
jgi:hypothetical protein